MPTPGPWIVLFIIGFAACSPIHPRQEIQPCDENAVQDAVADSQLVIKGALLSTRYTSFEQLKSVVKIEYVHGNEGSDDPQAGDIWVRLTHCSHGQQVISELKNGVSETDFLNARDGSLWDRLALILKSPYAVIHRKDMQRVMTLARRRPDIYGDGDPAFYDIAEKMMANIKSEDTALMSQKDRDSEKGYFNTINHISAQVFMTAIFSEKLADFMADAHERRTIPELITGKFTEEQTSDLENGPVDNYIDIINNEWGQVLGQHLSREHNIHHNTFWTPVLLADFLNDIQRYYSWAFDVGFKPFRSGDEIVRSFSQKLNVVMSTEFGSS